MRLFGKAEKKNGWLAIGLTADGVQAAAIERRSGALPRVLLAASYPGQADQAGASLARLGKELQAGRYRCTTLLGAGGYQLLMVEAPNVPDAEMKTALGWRVTPASFQELQAHPAVAGVRVEAKRLELKPDRRWGRK